MDFGPAPSRGGWLGLGLLAAALFAEGLVVWQLGRMLQGGLGPLAAVLGLLAAAVVPLVAWLGYWVWGYFSLRYHVDRDGVVIRWAAHRHILPMRAITHLLVGRSYAAALHGLHWPGYDVGRTAFRDDSGQLRELLVSATTPPSGQLVLMTGDLAYAISPADCAGFIEEFKIRGKLGALQPLEQQTLRPRWAGLTIWRDDLALRILALGILVNALAWAWLAWHYPTLPPRVALQAQYDPALAQTIAGPAQPLPAAWILPSIGLAALLVNVSLAATVHARAQLGARLLICGAVLVQLALAVVLVRIASS